MARRRVVCTLTGHGLKDPDTAILRSTKPTVIKPVDGCEILKGF